MEQIKIAIIVDDSLETWQACNVSAFLGSGVTENLKGYKYKDDSGNTYVPLLRYPILIYGSKSEKLKKLLVKATNKNISTGIFTYDMFQTFNDEDNRKTLIGKKVEEIRAAGIVIFGEKKEIDKTIRGYKFYDGKNQVF